MGFLDRILNGVERVVDAMDEGLEKRGVAGMVGYGASAFGGEVVVQTMSTGVSLFCKPGEGDAIDQKYEELYHQTKAKVGKYDGKPVKALASLGGNALGNTAKLSVAAAGAVARKIKE